MMSSASSLHSPTSDEIDVIKQSSQTLSTHASVIRVQMSVSGSTGEANNMPPLAYEKIEEFNRKSV